MAKKEKEVVEDKNTNFKGEIEKIISKKYGSVMFDGSYIKNNPKKLIPTTASLDIVLNGGIPEGGVYLIAGKPKSGKSSLSLQIAANAQKQGRHVYYLDIEHRFTVKNLTTVAHLQTTPDVFTLIESTKEKKLSAQDFLNIANDIMANHPNCVIILDSISSLCSENELSREIGVGARPEGPTMFGTFCRQNASTIPLNNITLIGIVHIISNTSGFGSPTSETGGNKIQFAMNGKFVVKGVSAWEEGSGEEKVKIGQIVQWLIAEQANGPPGSVVKSYLRYNYGYDSEWELVNLGIDLGLITKKGAWFEYLPNENNPETLIKKQGQGNMYEYFKNNPEELNKLYVKVKEMSV